ncbi:MAG: sugar phosphate nucleotidyltransferase [Ethanoligenens sp.]
MEAVIMAGGEGTRLRPLTCDCPKPMARLCGRPALNYIIELLAKNEITHATVTLRYLPEEIRRAYPDGHYAGVALRFVEENTPLGTAGSVRNATESSSDDVLVISGDALCDFDLRAALQFHKKSGAAATLLLSHVADPREYGLVVTAPDGRVRGFIEKPGWSQSVTDAVNTGIYILSPQALAGIPQGKAYDFGKDLFPRMLREDMPLYGFDADGYWCDIGDIGAYIQSQFDLLDGKVSAYLPNQAENGVYVKGAMPAGRYTLRAPVFLGANVSIGEDAVIGPYTVVDDGCTIGTRATVRQTVLLPDAYVGARCELRGVLVCAGASLGARARLFEGAVVGANAVVGRDASVAPGVRVWPGKRVEDGAHAAQNIKSGAARRGVFDDDGVTGEVGIDLTPEFCARLGAAAGEVTAHGLVAVGDDGSNVGKTMKQALAAGALSSGARVLDFGSAFEAQFVFCSTFCSADLGVFARAAGARVVLRLFDGEGLPLCRKWERDMEAHLSTGEIARCLPGEYGIPEQLAGMSVLYERALSRLAPEGLSGMSVTVRSANRQAKQRLTQVLDGLSCAPGGLRLHLTASGGEASFFDEEGTYLSPLHTLALGCMIAFEQGEDVALPYEAPRALNMLAEQYGRRVLRYLSCPADAADKEARLLAARQPWVRDGLQNGVRILGYLQSNGLRLRDAVRSLPAFAVSVRSVSLAGNPGELLRAFAGEMPAGVGEGVLLERQRGKVLLSPLKRGKGLRILAEAADMEAADELCFTLQKELQNGGSLDKP